MRFYKTTPFQKLFYPSCTWKRNSTDTIYLTFDDGPDEVVTPWVLNELEKVEAKATFFCIGRNLDSSSAILNEMNTKGHRIGNHTFSHCNGWKISADTYAKDAMLCDDRLKANQIDTSLFRPPYGKIRRSQIRKLGEKKIIMWSYLSWDFATRFNPGESIQKLKRAGAGDIVLFHDSPKAFRNLQKILPPLLEHYRSKGLKFGVLT